MSYERALNAPCLRYRGDFLAMMLDAQETLIFKVYAERVNDLIARGIGTEFNVTKKRFKELVLIPQENEDNYEGYLFEALAQAQRIHTLSRIPDLWHRFKNECF